MDFGAAPFSFPFARSPCAILIRRLLSICLFLAGLLMMGSLTHAHNLFLVVEERPEGGDLIDIIFEHAPFPGNREVQVGGTCY